MVDKFVGQFDGPRVTTFPGRLEPAHPNVAEQEPA